MGTSNFEDNVGEMVFGFTCCCWWFFTLYEFEVEGNGNFFLIVFVVVLIPLGFGFDGFALKNGETVCLFNDKPIPVVLLFWIVWEDNLDWRFDLLFILLLPLTVLLPL